MSTVTAAEMRAIEEAAFRRGIPAGGLMDRAGAGIAARLFAQFPNPGCAVGYLGKGNNAGDTLVVLDHLRRAGWDIHLRASHPEDQWSPLTRERLRRLAERPAPLPPLHPLRRPLLLLDGLLGIGARGPLREPLAELADEMNRLRRRHGAVVAAIDLPSGLDSDRGEAYPGAVVADLTITVAVPKQGLLADAAVGHCGRLSLVPLANLPPPEAPGPVLTGPESFPELLPPRPHEAHKGDAGRVSILAGSPGTDGAASLTAWGALRAGAGLVTLFAHPAARVTTPPEVMVKSAPDRFAAIGEQRADAWVIGPGIGQEQADALFRTLEESTLPAVLDADALNLLAGNGRLDLLREHHLITPHPGEFARLAPELAQLPRLEAAAAFVARHPCTLLLKGARTLVARRDRDPAVNPTGHAGMACGGQGDLLAGVCGALLAAGHEPYPAGLLGAWLCGRAAEHALAAQSEESCLPSDSLPHFGTAFRDWRERRR